MTNDSKRSASIQVKKGLTRTLLKFCQDHKYPDLGLLQVRECLRALEQGDVKAAVQAYQKVPLGGRMGYFDEWVPPVAFRHETPEYVHFVFSALVAQWRSVMDLSLQVDD
jgi:hypothetical protein